MDEKQYSLRYQVGLELLRSLREKAGLRQSDLADRLGVRQNFVSKIENAERRLDFAELALWCDGLEIPLEEFVKIWSTQHSKAKISKPKVKRVPAPVQPGKLAEVKKALGRK